MAWRLRRGGWARRRVVALVPVFFVGVGGWLLADAVRFAGRAVATMGEVIAVDVSTRRDRDSGAVERSFTPVVRFTLGDGRSHVARSRLSSSAFDYPRGTRVEVLYDPEDPDDMRFPGLWRLYGVPALFVVFGLAVLAAILRVGRGAETPPPADDGDSRRDRTPPVRR